MSASIADLLEYIHREVAYAAFGVKVLDTVYIAPEGKEIMELSAPGFFEITNIALQRDVFLALARLTDPPKTSGFENISIRRLVNSLPADLDAAMRSGLDAEVAELEKRAEPVREWRMKYLAHNDLGRGLGEALATVSIEVVRDVLHRIAAIVTEVGRIMNPQRYTLPAEVMHVGGGKRLLRVLRQGLEKDDGILGSE
jgi:hypothetical protein